MMDTIRQHFIGSKQLTCLLITFLVCAATFAQTKFYCQASDKTIARNETLQIDYVIENAGSINDVQLPDFKNFAVLSGPNQSSQSSTIGQKTISSYTISFLLQPKGAGTFTLPAATARINNKTMTTNTVNVVVENKESKNPRQPSLSPSINMTIPQMDMPDVTDNEDVYLKPGEDVNEKIKKNMQVVLQVSKNTCYVGEPIVATYKLCTRLRSDSRVTKRPSLDGFSVYDMEDAQTVNPRVENIGGKPFTVHVIRKVQLYPLQAGTFQLEPVELENNIKFIRQGAQSRSSSRDPLQRLIDNFGNRNWEEHLATIASKPATIVVKPLPENKPASFNGAVGNFKMETKLSVGEINAEDDATLSVVIKGTGNIPMINAPAVNFPKTFESFDAKVKEETDKTESPISGSKQFDFMFIPTDTGTFTIPPVNFSYFDPAAGVYKTVSSEPLTIHVLKALQQKKKVANPAAPSAKKSFSFSWWYWVAGGIILILILLLFIKRKKAPVAKAAQAIELTDTKNEVQQVPLAPVETIPVVEADPLAKARQALNENDSKEFFSSIQNTLWEEVSRKTEMAPSRLDKKTALQLLEQKNVSITVRLELENLLNTCEMALYMPQNSGDMQNALYKATFVVNALKA